jgi:hypothetical protein
MKSRASGNAMNEELGQVFKRSVGKTITALKITELDRLHFAFVDDSELVLFDNGQDCCEHRYMHTDDDLQYFVGAKFLGAEVRDGPTTSEDYEVKESQFLIISTDKGQFTVVNYNEHNGYYGGFSIAAWELTV